MTLGERVKLVREERGWSQAEVARRVTRLRQEKTSQVAIHHIEKRGDVNPGFVVELAQALEVNLDWLRRGRGPKEIEGQSRKAFRHPAHAQDNKPEVTEQPALPMPLPERPATPEPSPAPAATQPAPRLPVHLSALGGAKTGLMILSSDPVAWIARDPRLIGVPDAYGVYISGESMVPAYEPGDLALVNPSLPLRREAYCIFQGVTRDGSRHVLIKRYMGESEKAWRVRQYQPSKDFELSKAEWFRPHVVIGKYDRAV